MASLNNNKMLFFTTSPRTPFKMIPEIKLLGEQFTGESWNKVTQVSFIKLLVDEGFFNGKGSQNNLDFSARDRINRAPKSLGFVDLTPKIKLTEVGQLLVDSKRKEEILLRQLLKFQLPSPYHTAGTKNSTDFWVKPYLEILRLINHFGTLSFDELMLFGLQLTNYKNFEEIVSKIDSFRVEKATKKGKYKILKSETLENIIHEIYKDEVENGDTNTRESTDRTVKKFISTKSSNMRDYADACFRYLRSTGIVNISQKGHSLSIAPEKRIDVEYILKTIDRNPVFTDDVDEYKKYLFSPELPVLYTDNRDTLVEKVLYYTSNSLETLEKMTNIELKDILFDEIERKKQSILDEQVKTIKDYRKFDEIMATFDDIEQKNVMDIPLMLEWNTWRAMTMLDGGNIKANLKFDDSGEPMSTAQGNMADICCDYDEYALTVEVTMSSGAKQYEMESESVLRHLGKFKKDMDKSAYCLFIAPKISEYCIAYFFSLHKINLSIYGGTSIVVPMTVETFKKMLTDSYKAEYQPNPTQVQSLFDYSMEVATNAESEIEWYNKLTERALNWLTV